jgi:hypothetical protein
MDGRVFISYSSDDSGVASCLCDALESRGIACWVAPRDIQPGADWAEQIIDGISQAAVMLLVFSSRSNASAQVKREVERAVHRGVPLLPVRIENLQPSKSLEYFLSAQHWLDAHGGPIEQYTRQIADAVGAMGAMPKVDLPVPDDAGAVVLERSPRRVVSAAPSEATLARIKTLLAEYVGPVAATLVQRAAARAPDRGALVNALASEIDDPTGRHAFIVACQTAERCD